jgi:soluble lytic murein transglycosylase
MLLEHDDHENAIEPLEDALQGLELIGDHILLRLAGSHAALNRHEDSTGSVNMLLKQYPKSPVKQKAIRIKTINIAEQDPEKAIPAYRSYLDGYPSDDGIRSRYALALKDAGRTREADAELARVFINAGPGANEAYNNMTSKDLSKKQWAERAGSLMDRQAYANAEIILRNLVRGEDGGNSFTYKKKLANCLFRQRKYKSAAPLFMETGSLYRAARSFIRSDNEREFKRVAKRMLRERHPDTPRLFIAYANDLRRDGKNRLSRKTLEKVIKNFPGAREQATWALGWLFYVTGRYDDALEKFTYLAGRYKNDEYDSARYRYWQARAMEKTGRDSTALFAAITGEGYYPYLSSLRTGIMPDIRNKLPGKRKATIDLSRADLLIEVGMLREAAWELSAVSKKKLNDNDLLAVAYRMQAARNYRQAMLLALKLPEKKRHDDILYPLAYWDEVSGISSRYTMDPLLVLSLMREESRFDNKARSPVGAMGLMQLMPATARATAHRVKVRINGNHSIFKVENNILLGTHYLSGLMREFRSVPASLAAYNAGESRVRKWLREGNYEEFDEFIEDIPFKETRGYVKRIIRSLFKYKTYLGENAIELSQMEL